jgi:hypothetical protein
MKREPGGHVKLCRVKIRFQSKRVDGASDRHSRGDPVHGSDLLEFHNMKHVFISWYFQQYYNENPIVKGFKNPLAILKT